MKTLIPLGANEEVLIPNMGVSPTWALCLPNNCTERDVFEIMKVNSSMGFEFTSFVCQTLEDVNIPLSNAAIITMYVYKKFQYTGCPTGNCVDHYLGKY